MTKIIITKENVKQIPTRELQLEHDALIRKEIPGRRSKENSRLLDITGHELNRRMNIRNAIDLLESEGIKVVIDDTEVL